MDKFRLIGVTAVVLVGTGCVGKAPMDSRRVEASPGVYSVAEANNAKRVVDVIGSKQVRCKRRRPIGTNLTRTSCNTLAEETANREADQTALRKQQRLNQPRHWGSTLGRLEPEMEISPGGGR